MGSWRTPTGISTFDATARSIKRVRIGLVPRWHGALRRLPALDSAVTTPREESVLHSYDHRSERESTSSPTPGRAVPTSDTLTAIVARPSTRCSRSSERGGVLGAMDTMVYGRRIPEASMVDPKKCDGAWLLPGLNMFLPKEEGGDVTIGSELIRSRRRRRCSGSPASRRGRTTAIAGRPEERPLGQTVGREDLGEGVAYGCHGLSYLQRIGRERKNAFAALMVSLAAQFRSVEVVNLG